MVVAGAAVLAALVIFFIWTRNVMLPTAAARLARAAQNGRVEARTSLESLRDTAEHLRFAARAWYTAAGAPAVNGLTVRATEAVRNAHAAQRLLCLLYTSDAADDLLCVDLGGR